MMFSKKISKDLIRKERFIKSNPIVPLDCLIKPFYIAYRLIKFFFAFLHDTFTVYNSNCKSTNFKPNPYKKNSIFRTEEISMDLSVIIPVYNVEAYLKDCLLSVINQQTMYSYELIIVNDCSSDSSSKIINDFKFLKNVRVVTHKTNRGTSAAKNSAMEIAKGKYIKFVDSDDILSKRTINTLMSLAMKYNSDIVEGCVVSFKNSLEISKINSTLYEEIVLHNYCDISLIAAGFACGKIYKKEIFKNINFPEGLVYEDGIIRKIVLRKAKIYVKTSEPIYFYRRDNYSSITKSVKKNNFGCDHFYMINYCVCEFFRLGFKADTSFYKLILSEAGHHLYQRTDYMEQCDICYMLKEISKTLAYIESQMIDDLKLTPIEQILRWSIFNVKVKVWRTIAGTKNWNEI